jgi:CheY-like chemotaxis protein
MRLIFVDDEERVLSGVARSLFALGVTWDVTFATSGEQALAQLELAPADAVISDLRMPGMDGRALLREVRTRWPRTFRILLSGGGDHFATSPLDEVHQFLVKPCDGITIVDAIERLHSLRSLLQTPALRGIVEYAGLLPAPQVYRKLMRCIASPAPNESAAVILAGHPTLLRNVVASPLFLRGEDADSILRADFDRLLLTVLALEVFAGTQLSRRAMMSALLAERVAVGRPFVRDAMTAALLCAVGTLMPDIEASCRRADLRGEGTYTPVEAGAYLINAWRFPMPIVEAVAFHREPWRVHPRQFGVVSVAYVASCLARNIEPSGEYLKRCGVFGELTAWKRLAEELKTQSLQWPDSTRQKQVSVETSARKTEWAGNTSG